MPKGKIALFWRINPQRQMVNETQSTDVTRLLPYKYELSYTAAISINKEYRYFPDSLCSTNGLQHRASHYQYNNVVTTENVRRVLEAGD
jgi:hypothetical protein